MIVGRVMLSGSLRVLLADGHEAMLERIKGLLDGEFEVVGAVDNGQALVDAVRQLDPDVVVVDIEMPLFNGLDAVAQIRKSGNTAKVVFLALQEDPQLVPLCLDAGALGFVVKSRLAADLVPAIRLALTNRTFVSPTLPRIVRS
jgi:DNA-binding NarL/FixJ family response regulator